jgi:hypothetical protein
MTIFTSLRDLLARNISKEQSIVDAAKEAEPIIRECNYYADLVGVAQIKQRDFSNRYNNLSNFIEEIQKKGITEEEEYLEKEKELFALIKNIDSSFKTKTDLSKAREFLEKNIKKSKKKRA